jgi:hypothetical protein
LKKEFFSYIQGVTKTYLSLYIMKQLTPLLLVFIFISCEPNVEVDEEIIYDGNLSEIRYHHHYIIGGPTINLDTVQNTTEHNEVTKINLTNGDNQLRFKISDIDGNGEFDSIVYFNNNDSIIFDWMYSVYSSGGTWMRHTYVDYKDSIYCKIHLSIGGGSDNWIQSSHKVSEGYLYPM